MSAASEYPREAAPVARFTAWDHFKISAYWFGANFLWGAFFGPVLSTQVTHLAPAHSAGTISMIGRVATWPALLIPLLFGPLSDRCMSKFGRRRPFIGWGAALGVLGVLASAAAYKADSLLGYLAGYIVIQFGTNVALAAYSGVIPDLVPLGERGKASGMMAVMSQLGTLAGALVTGMVLGGSVTSLYVMAAVLAAFAAFTLVTMKETPLAERPPAFDVGKYFSGLWISPKKYPDFAWVWLTRALMMTGFYMIVPYLLPFLRDAIHVEHPAKQSAIVFAIILASATLSGYFGGRLSDQHGRKKIVTLSTFVIAAMCAAFIFIGTLEGVLLAGILFGIGYGAYISVDWALGTDVLPNKEEAGKDMAVWHIAMTLPQAYASTISGTFILEHCRGPVKLIDGDMVTTYLHSGYGLVFAVAGVFFLMSGLLVRKVKGST